jgi:hypothetical protein
VRVPAPTFEQRNPEKAQDLERETIINKMFSFKITKKSHKLKTMYAIKSLRNYTNVKGTQDQKADGHHHREGQGGIHLQEGEGGET